MKKLVFAAAICLAVIASIIVSCKKNEHENMNHAATEKNINYPAAYIVNGGSNTISVIDLATETVKETIELNGATFPHHIYLSPDKATMAVAITSTDLSAGHGGGHGGGTGGYKVMIIDAVKGTIHHEIALTKLPHNAVYSPDGKELWVGQSDTMQSTVNVYNTTDYSLIKSIAVGKQLSETTFSADGSRVFATNTMSNSVSVINPTTKMVDNTITVGTDPVGAWPGMNGFVYVDNEIDKTVTEIKVSDLSKTDTISLGFKPGYVAFYHHKDELWVSDATNGKVVYYTLQSGNWTKAGEITTGADAHAIAFNADGSKAYISNQGAGSVSVINPTTHQVTKIITVGAKPNGIIFKQ